MFNRITRFIQFSSKPKCITEFEKRIFDINNNISIKETLGNNFLISNKKFKINDIIYTNMCYLIPNDYNEKISLNLKDNNNKITKYMVDKTNTVKINKTERLLYTYDGYMNHSCDPNTYFHDDNSIDDNNFSMVASSVASINCAISRPAI
jgi:hypothetical protein